LPRKELPDILDKQAEKVIDRLRPELDFIHVELKKGNERFKEHRDQLQEIKIECAARKATCPGVKAPDEKKKWGAKDVTLKIGLPTVGGGGAIGLAIWLFIKLIQSGVFG
jgi:hypothetical protein